MENAMSNRIKIYNGKVILHNRILENGSVLVEDGKKSLPLKVLSMIFLMH